MTYWLIKSEPSAWSWDMQVAAGTDGTGWTGVRNHTAKLHMMAMKLGDQAFFYHSNDGKEVVGVVEVCREYHPDPTDSNGKFGMVDFRSVKQLPKTVTLTQVKETPALQNMSLVKSFRLSVQPVRDEEWDLVCKMGGM